MSSIGKPLTLMTFSRQANGPSGLASFRCRFAHAGLKLTGGEAVEASFDITNTGDRAGTETAQVYARIAGDGKRDIRRQIKRCY